MSDFIIYIVDDEETIRSGIAVVLEPEYTVYTYSTAEAALEAMDSVCPDLVLLDIGLPGMDGIAALKAIKESRPEVMVMMITAYEDVNSVISAMKTGAYDYVIKPIQMDRLELSIGNALESIKLKKELNSLQEQYLEENMPFFIGKSDVIQDVMEFVKLIAKSPDTPVLILGETGTGKELIAKTVHFRSPNFKGPLVTMNCASLPGELIESELFGYEKGAFTGATPGGKKGLIEEAANGTLFLDEVGDLSLTAQAKLLRFLEEGEFYRVGGTRLHKVETRVVSATNRDLKKMIVQGKFRKDLFYRLGVVTVEVPSLNRRTSDIEHLAMYFLQRYSAKFNRTLTRISSDALDALKAYDWTGNIRELKNVIERAVLIGRGPELTTDDLGLCRVVQNNTETSAGLPQISSDGIDLHGVMQDIEAFYLKTALDMAGGNESAAARLLRMNHHTYRYKLRKLHETGE